MRRNGFATGIILGCVEALNNLRFTVQKYPHVLFSKPLIHLFRLSATSNKITVCPTGASNATVIKMVRSHLITVGAVYDRASFLDSTRYARS